jgi:hypothetical protein
MHSRIASAAKTSESLDANSVKGVAGQLRSQCSASAVAEFRAPSPWLLRDLRRENAPNDIDETSEFERLREYRVRLTERSIVHPVSQEENLQVVPSPTRPSD